MSRYRGRHRKPSHTGRNLAVIATTGAFALPITGVALAEPAQADILDEIAQCESGGNPRAQNPTSSASGTWQFIRSTWLGIGGGQFAPTAAQATPAQQRQMAERLYAQQGTTPWNASRSCWAGKSGATPRITGGTAPRQSEAPKVKPRSKAQGATTAGGLTGVRAADGTGAYICGPATYYLAKCDPGDDGQVMQYPPFTSRAAKSAPVGKAAHVKRHWPNAPADLHRRDANGHGNYLCDTDRLGYQACDTATLGQVVAYPAFDRH